MRSFDLSWLEKYKTTLYKFSDLDSFISERFEEHFVGGLKNIHKRQNFPSHLVTILKCCSLDRPYLESYSFKSCCHERF